MLSENSPGPITIEPLSPTPAPFSSQSKRLPSQRVLNGQMSGAKRLSKTDEVVNYGRSITPQPSPTFAPTSPSTGSRRLQRSGTFTPNQMSQMKPFPPAGTPPIPHSRGAPLRGGSVRGRGVGRGAPRGAPVV